MTKKERFKIVLDYFSKHQPIAETELLYKDPFQLLVAVILSAQCTDVRVNLTTPALFKKFGTPKKMAAASQEEVFELIKSISYPNNKTKHLIGMANMLLDEFDGQLPEDVNELQRLPGVGRKTANVVASSVFNQPRLAVDTHVFRVSARLGLSTNAKTPLQTELQLIKFIPENQIAIAHHWLILHGRYVCVARKPKCEQCPFRDVCKYYSKIARKENKKIIN